MSYKMHHFVCTINWIILYCFWFFHNIFEDTIQCQHRTTESTRKLRIKGRKMKHNSNRKINIRFSSLSSCEVQRKIILSTYIHEKMTPKELSTSNGFSRKGSPKSCSLSVNPSLPLVELSRKDYTKLWLQSFCSLE
ncbi:hypothetical protein HHI36_019878 [Cryptolaemus montrouzieri]|uniref:Uncharacterized protein n=1 Tax=Cryptolaemus montrouzieri TaxID=559131 RepID=A0ABD2N921_9CUCU